MKSRLKDFVTLLNLGAGFLSIVLSIEGNLFWAANLIFIAYFFDVMDGLVAKLTKTGNRFGAELDNACDAFSFGVAPAVLAYAFFGKIHPTLGFCLGLWLTVCGVLRTVRSQFTPKNIGGYFLGLNRPVSAMIIAAMVNSVLFNHFRLVIPGVLLTVALGFMNLTLTPYVNHRQPFTGTMKVLVYSASAVTLLPATLLGSPWDGVLALLFLYSIHPFLWIRGAERARIDACILELRLELRKGLGAAT